MKFLKWLAIFAVILIALVLIVFHLALGPLVRRTATANLTRITGTETTIEELKINAWRGRLHLAGLQIDNPDGFESPFFFRLGEFKINLQPRSLRHEMAIVESLTIDGVEFNFEYDKRLTDGNLGTLAEQIRSNLESQEPPTRKEPDKALRVEHFSLTDVKLRFHSPTLSDGLEEIVVPAIELRDLKLPGEVSEQAIIEVLLDPLAGIAEQPAFGRVAAAIGAAELTQFIGTEVTIGDIQLDARNGLARVKEINVGNPPGYNTAEAFLLGEISIEIDRDKLFSDPLVIRQVVVDQSRVTYEAKTRNILQSNVMEILTRIREQIEEKELESDEKVGPEVHIDRFVFQNARVSLSATVLLGQTLTLPMPDLELTDLGKDEGVNPTLQIIDGLIQAFVRLVTQSPSLLGELGSDGQQAIRQLGSGFLDRLRGIDREEGEEQPETEEIEDAIRDLGGSALDRLRSH